MDKHAGTYWVELGQRERDLDTARCWCAKFVHGTKVAPITLYSIHRGYEMDQHHPLGRFNMAWSLLYYHMRFVRGMSHFDARASLFSQSQAVAQFADQFLVPIGLQLHTAVSLIDIWLASNWNVLRHERQALVSPDWLDETVPERQDVPMSQDSSSMQDIPHHLKKHYFRCPLCNRAVPKAYPRFGLRCACGWKGQK